MRFLPYAQLLRLPNVFTAFADVLLGTAATGALLGRPGASGLLLLASGCLYCGGMVWNDYFDLDEDRRDRPFRPLPSGRVARGTARWLGVGLLLAGVLAAALAGAVVGTGRPAVVAVVLAAAILLYDAWLKRTPLGPLGMGACRFLNVLLAVSVADPGGFPWDLRVHLAGVVGVYIVGVTWFARQEAGRSSRPQLRGAALVVLAALGLALAVPTHLPAGTAAWAFPYLLVAFGFAVGLPAARAVATPEPGPVQAAVKRFILGLVALDAVLATAFVGPPGLAIVLLLVPALLLGRRVYST